MAERNGGWPEDFVGTKEEQHELYGTKVDMTIYVDGFMKPNPEEDNKYANKDEGRNKIKHAACQGQGCEGCTKGEFWVKNTANRTGKGPQKNNNVTSQIDLESAVKNGIGRNVLLPNGIPGIQVGEVVFLTGGLYVKPDKKGKLMVHRMPTQTENSGGSNVKNLPAARPSGKRKKAS